MAKTVLSPEEYDQIVHDGPLLRKSRSTAYDLFPTGPQDLVSDLRRARSVLRRIRRSVRTLEQQFEDSRDLRRFTEASLRRVTEAVAELEQRLQTDTGGRVSEVKAYLCLQMLVRAGRIADFVYAAPGGPLDFAGVDFLAWAKSDANPCPLQVKSSRAGGAVFLAEQAVDRTGGIPIVLIEVRLRRKIHLIRDELAREVEAWEDTLHAWRLQRLAHLKS